MEQVFIEGTSKSPKITLDPLSGIIELSGRSIPENPEKLFKPVKHWLEEYLNSPQSTTTVNFDLEYFNTSTSMWIFHMLKDLEKLNTSRGNITVNWFYTDDDDLDIADELKGLVDVPFNTIQKTEEVVLV